MKTTFPFFILSVYLVAFSLQISAQSLSVSAINHNDTNIARSNPLTIVYDIQVKTNKRKTNIEETYNGGIKVVFINKDMARIRLVSLMRIQSLFFSTSINANHPFCMVKESGKKKYKYNLTNEEWNLYNAKYSSDSCVFTNDSIIILNYLCRKAIVMLKDGRHLTAYYTNQLKPVSSKIEPAFKGIPGLVLQYEYDFKKGSVIYTANKITQGNIAGNIFRIPTKGYILKKYSSKKNSEEKDISNPDIDD